jgi:hypothetical protein
MMCPSNLSGTALPVESRAGLKRARRVRMPQVASSRLAEPLEWVTVQPVTAPAESMSSRKSTFPCSCRRSAPLG